MSANPHPGASQSESMPMMMDPRVLPFPPQLAQHHEEHVAMYGSPADTLAMPAQLPYIDHGPAMAPVTEPAYAAEPAEYYAPVASSASMSVGVASSGRTVEQRRRLIMLGATAIVLVVAAVAFAIAWQVASGRADDASSTGSTSSEQIDATGGGEFGGAGEGGFAPGVDPRTMGTPPAGAGTGAGAPGAAGARPAGAAPSGAMPARASGGGTAPPVGMPSMGSMPSPGAMIPPSGGYRDAPAVQPVSGTPSASPRPAAANPRPAAGAPGAQPPAGNPGGMGAMTGMGAGAMPGMGAGAPAAATPTANPVNTGNLVQPGAAQPGAGQPGPAGAGAGRPGAAVPQAQGAGAAAAAQVIIAVKTTAGTWQLYKTDPRRVALQSNPAGANLQGAMAGMVWLANSWQPAYILAAATGTGVTGGGAATPATTGGGAPMKR